MPSNLHALPEQVWQSQIFQQPRLQMLCENISYVFTTWNMPKLDKTTAIADLTVW